MYMSSNEDFEAERAKRPRLQIIIFLTGRTCDTRVEMRSIISADNCGVYLGYDMQLSETAVSQRHSKHANTARNALRTHGE